MRLSKKPQSPPPEPVEEEDPSSESDGIEKRDPSQAKKRKISDLQRTPPRNDAGSESDGKVPRRASSRTPSGAAQKKSTSRIFGEEDEVCILNHIIEYKKENGVDPSSDMDGFYKYVIGDLVADITKTQLYEKLRRFRNKYFKTVKLIANDENFDHGKPHDEVIFDLSEKIWGDGVEEENGISKGSDEKSKKGGKDGNLGSVTSPRKMKKAASVIGVDDGQTVESNGVDENEKLNGVAKKSDRKSKKKSKKAKDGNLAASPVKQKNVQNSSAVLEEGLKDVEFEKEYPYTVQAYASMASRGVITAEQASFLKENLSAAGNATREFEKKWKELLEKETEIAVQKLEVFTHHSRQVLDGMNI